MQPHFFLYKLGFTGVLTAWICWCNDTGEYRIPNENIRFKLLEQHRLPEHNEGSDQSEQRL